ncbi:MAG: hypothetical protein ACI9BD_000019 [Candidatus Marinamargulisbacteria bacterium]|jgi:hypothetical protein
MRSESPIVVTQSSLKTRRGLALALPGASAAANPFTQTAAASSYSAQGACVRQIHPSPAVTLLTPEALADLEAAGSEVVKKSGGQGELQLCEATGTATKTIRLNPAADDPEGGLASALGKAEFMQGVRHANILSPTELSGDPDKVVMIFPLLKEVEKPELKGLSQEVKDGLHTQIVAALGALHATGQTHNDVKPENMMVVKEEGAYKVYLIDFDAICRIGEESNVRGNPYYEETVFASTMQGDRDAAKSALDDKLAGSIRRLY